MTKLYTNMVLRFTIINVFTNNFFKELAVYSTIFWSEFNNAWNASLLCNWCTIIANKKIRHQTGCNTARITSINALNQLLHSYTEYVIKNVCFAIILPYLEIEISSNYQYNFTVLLIEKMFVSNWEWLIKSLNY